MKLFQVMARTTGVFATRLIFAGAVVALLGIQAQAQNYGPDETRSRNDFPAYEGRNSTWSNDRSERTRPQLDRPVDPRDEMYWPNPVSNSLSRQQIEDRLFDDRRNYGGLNDPVRSNDWQQPARRPSSDLISDSRDRERDAFPYSTQPYGTGRYDTGPNDNGRYDSSRYETRYREELYRNDDSRNLPFDSRWNNARDRSRDFVPTAPSSWDRNSNWNNSSNMPQDPRLEPAPATLQKNHPTIQQLISRRYRDQRILQTLSSMSPQAAESFYLETAQLIDARALAPSAYPVRTAKALENLYVAVDNQEFVNANRLQVAPQQRAAFQQAISQIGGQAQPRNAQEAIQVMRQVAQMSQQIVGLRPQVVAMEFTYGALETLDEYSTFMPNEVSGGPSTQLGESLVGIGVEIEAHPLGLKVLKAITGGPAAQATIKRGDIITMIGGRSIAGMELDEAANLIKGPLGSMVQLQVKRGDYIADMSLMRSRVQIQSVAEVRMEDQVNKVGYIKLDKFAETTSRELDQALMNLHQQGMQSLILDLRGNPGGLLTTAIEVTNRFLPGGTIVSTKGRNQADNSQEVANYPNTWKVPLVVLIDNNSASASEIFAAAIQDHQRGVVVGQRSYGKGSVQTQFPLKTVNGGLKLTTAKFYAPSGREMAGQGVIPDVAVPLAQNAMDTVDYDMQAAVKLATDSTTRNMAETIARRYAPQNQFLGQAG
ncbi:carboxyl-terminal protease [Planctopirus limnophila DSM 3776]|uniref:Carboxyl-terminal protease n=1 Tax=Planctopirus limnophila (strain ATCC 43296 / DSM 3776 / IFAM 1008 / Mu 290) TaxID=521674 RepID=D5SUZ8_PLAL2|nr:S41 family peptidase [Planctopirus limnophila]ADG69284.1 carboxyl-terminal protease [Planctopirus limnophila DSM 3776]